MNLPEFEALPGFRKRVTALEQTCATRYVGATVRSLVKAGS
jgi:hypothetical protein